MNNELLFYGGIVITSLSIICLLFCIVINRCNTIAAIKQKKKKGQ